MRRKQKYIMVIHCTLHIDWAWVQIIKYCHLYLASIYLVFIYFVSFATRCFQKWKVLILLQIFLVWNMKEENLKNVNGNFFSCNSKGDRRFQAAKMMQKHDKSTLKWSMSLVHYIRSLPKSFDSFVWEIKHKILTKILPSKKCSYC